MQYKVYSTDKGHSAFIYDGEDKRWLEVETDAESMVHQCRKFAVIGKEVYEILSKNYSYDKSTDTYRAPEKSMVSVTLQVVKQDTLSWLMPLISGWMD